MHTSKIFNSWNSRIVDGNMRNLVRNGTIYSYEADMNPEQLFECISQTLLASIDRDSYSGWGAEIIIITPERIITREIKTRMD